MPTSGNITPLALRPMSPSFKFPVFLKFPLILPQKTTIIKVTLVRYPQKDNEPHLTLGQTKSKEI
jgi:hypothetical protein